MVTATLRCLHLNTRHPTTSRLGASTQAGAPGTEPTELRVAHTLAGRHPQSRRGDAWRRWVTLTLFPADAGL